MEYGVTRRHGYLYTIEGLIAALLFLFYLSFVFAPPTGTDWTQHTLQDRGEQVTNALEQNGMLTTAAAEDSEVSLNALLAVMDAGMRYTVNMTGLPAKQVDVGVTIPGKEIAAWQHTNDTPESWTGLRTGPDDYAVYRNATVFDVDVVVSDIVNDSIIDFTAAQFDFNDNNDFSDTGEGPYTVSQRFRCSSTADDPPSGCDGDDWYELGGINYSTADDRGHLTLYNASRTRQLDQRLTNTSINEFRTSIGVDGVSFNPVVEPFPRILRKDVIYIDGVSLDTVNQSMFRDRLAAYLSTDGTVILRATPSQEQLQPSHTVNTVLGFSPSRFGVVNTDDTMETNNTFTTTRLFTEGAAHTAAYFNAIGISHGDVVEDSEGSDPDTLLERHGWDVSGVEGSDAVEENTYLAGNTTVRGVTFHTVAANTTAETPGFDTLYFSTDTLFTTMDANASIGENLTLTVETFTVQDVDPVTLQPENQDYRFQDLFTTAVVGDDILVERTDYRYNVSEYDIDNIELTTDTVPGAAPPGIPNGSNVCGKTEKDYYQNRSLSVPGSDATYQVWATNFSLGDCDPGVLTFVSFDFNDDDWYNWTGNASFSGEGLWQDGDTIQVNGDAYTVRLVEDVLSLERAADDTVGTVIRNNNVVEGSGTATLLRNLSTTGDDEYGLVKSILLQTGQNDRVLGDPDNVPGTAAGYRFHTVSDGELFLPVEGRAVWWFQ